MNVMNKPIVCIDLDGTLVNHRGSIHPKDIEILNSTTEVTFVIATGRSLEGVRRTFKHYRIVLHPPIPFPMVLLNGTLVFGPNEHFILYHPFKNSIQEIILKIVCQFPQVTSLFMDARGIYQLNLTPFGQRSIMLFDFETKPFIKKSDEYSFGKVMCISESHDLLMNIHQLLENLDVELAFSMDSALEITSMGINKGSGLLTLVESQGWDPTTIIAVGDGENDFPLFEKARMSFSPSSSPANVQLRANYIINPTHNGILFPVMSMIL